MNELRILLKYLKRPKWLTDFFFFFSYLKSAIICNFGTVNRNRDHYRKWCAVWAARSPVMRTQDVEPNVGPMLGVVWYRVGGVQPRPGIYKLLITLRTYCSLRCCKIQFMSSVAPHKIIHLDGYRDYDTRYISFVDYKLEQ